MIILLFLTAGMAFFSGTVEVEDVKLMQENQEKNAVITVLPKEDTNTEDTTSRGNGRNGWRGDWLVCEYTVRRR